MSDALSREYEVCEEVGRGQFGAVFRFFQLLTNQPFACKSISTGLLRDSTDRECLEKEPKIMICLPPHPNSSLCVMLLRMITISTSSWTSALLRPLQSHFKSPRARNEGAVVAESLLNAIAHWPHGACHRDVKLENVMFDSLGRLKLADFGSAEWFGYGRAMEGVVGTPYYVAPEVLMGSEYNEKVDVRSAGVILNIILAGFPPFYGETAEKTFEALVHQFCLVFSEAIPLFEMPI